MLFGVRRVVENIEGVRYNLLTELAWQDLKVGRNSVLEQFALRNGVCSGGAGHD